MSTDKVWRFSDKNVEKETVGLFEKFRPFLEISYEDIILSKFNSSMGFEEDRVGLTLGIIREDQPSILAVGPAWTKGCI